MLNKNAKKWVKALRSGKFKQTKGVLADHRDRFCCLGVACELAIKDGVRLKKRFIEDGGTTGCYRYSNMTEVLPRLVQRWLGLKHNDGSFMGCLKYDSLAEANDSGSRFESIARIIESQPEGLFRS